VDPDFLTLAEALAIHRDQIERYGGDAGIRDLSLLESAIAMPQAGVRGEYLHADLFEMAGAYLFHIVRNHPFLDGNKRTGLAAALVFLDLNGVDVEAGPAALERMVREVAEGRAGKPKLAAFFAKHGRTRRR